MKRSDEGQRERLWSAALALGSAVAAIASGVLAVTGHWTAVIDNAVIAVRAHDVFTRHIPLVGIYTSLTVAAHTSTRLHHLGPLEFWLAAIPARLGGPAGTGLPVAAAVINALAAAAIVWIGHRLGGPCLCALMAASTALLAWSVGGQILHDPWNPHLAIFVFAFLLAAVWALASGDIWMLPVVGFAASFVVQLHLPYAAPVAFVSIWGVGALVVALRRRRTELTDEQWLGLRRTLTRAVVATVVVVLACWSGPLVDQLTGSGNLGAVARAALGGGYPVLGIGIAWRDLVHATSIPPLWLRPVTSIVKPDTAPSAIDVVTSMLVLATLVGVACWAWAQRRARIAAVSTTALTACVGAFLTTMRTPATYHYQDLIWARRAWWPTGIFVWVALVAAAGSLAATRWPDAWPRARPAVVAAGFAALIVALVAAWPRLGPADDYGSSGFGAVRALAPTVAGSLHGSGPYLMTSEGAWAINVVAPGLASDLIYRGDDVVVPNSNFPDFGWAHFVHRASPPKSHVLVVSGAGAGRPRPGYRLVAQWDPATEGAPYRSYRQTFFLVPIDRVAVYLR
ncbi:MAG: hypothetical protein JOZ99_00275 [Actinobacteria bacterium]|nr:hypothetical protein [Actinomycetota bacterium]